MHSEWQNKVVLVAGGCGYVGSHLARLLVENGAHVRVVDDLSRGSLCRLSDIEQRIEFHPWDLRYPDLAAQACSGVDYVFNLAANASGIRYCMNHHASMFYENAVVSLNVMEGALREGVQRFVYFSSSSVYPIGAPVPTKEEFGREGRPDPGNAGYGWAKRIGELQADIYREHCGMSITVVRPVNIVGEGERYDLEIGHVIPSLIVKAHGADSLVVMGSGRQTRSFIYVRDLCDITLKIALDGTHLKEVNVCSPEEVTIAEIAKMVIEEMGKPDMPIHYDKRQPEGARRKAADVSQLLGMLGPYRFTPLREGIRRMIAEYRAGLDTQHGDGRPVSIAAKAA